MSDEFATALDTAIAPAANIVVVTPDDDTDLAKFTKGVICGVSGTLKVDTVDGQTVTLPASVVVAGQLLPIRVKRIHDTGTTADAIIALA